MALFKASQLSTSIDFSVVVSVLVLVVLVAVCFLAAKAAVGVVALSSWSTLNLLIVWSSFCGLVSAKIFTVWTAFTWELAELWLLPDVILLFWLLPDVILLFWLLAAWLPVLPPPLAKLVFCLVKDWLLTCRLIRLIASVVCRPVFSVAAWTGLPLIIIAPIAKTSSDEYNHNLPALYIL